MQFRFPAAVFDGVADDLSQKEAQPSPVRIGHVIGQLEPDPELLFLKQRTVIVQYLVQTGADR